MNYKKIVVAACIVAVSVSSMMLTSCRKTKMTEAEVSAVEDGVAMEGTSQETQNIAEQGLTGLSANMRLASNSGTLSSCATITNDTTGNGSNPDTLTVDFGNSNCVCHDGRIRNGKVIVSYTGRYHSSGAIIDIHFLNYQVGPSASNLFSIDNSSTRHIVNNGFNGNGFFSWNVTASMTIMKPNGGGTITYSESKLRTQIAGTPLHHDWSNKFDISGTATGTAANGTSFSATTATGKDLIRDMSCKKHFTQGELDITPSGKPMIAIDFGSGTCDNTATVTRNGVTKTITLR